MNFKNYLSFLLVAAGLGGFYFLANQPVVLRILVVLIGLGAAFAVFWTTPQGKQAIGFFGDAITEAKKSCLANKKRNYSDDNCCIYFCCHCSNFLSFS